MFVSQKETHEGWVLLLFHLDLSTVYFIACVEALQVNIGFQLLTNVGFVFYVYIEHCALFVWIEF